MEPFISHSGIVVPFDQANIDTDALVPKQYLKSVSKFGYADWLFDDARYLDPGEVETDTATRRLNQDFILNKEPYNKASVLVARDNFGCGSSREHAVWALRDFGFRVVIAPSFADIFYNNCFKNGLLPIALAASSVDTLMNEARHAPGSVIDVDLRCNTIQDSKGRSFAFELDAGRRKNLLEGKDEISQTLELEHLIKSFEGKLAEAEPWTA